MVKVGRRLAAALAEDSQLQRHEVRCCQMVKSVTFAVKWIGCSTRRILLLLPLRRVFGGAAVRWQGGAKGRFQLGTAPGIDRAWHGIVERDADFIVRAVGVADVAKTSKDDECESDRQQQAHQFFS